MSVDWIIPCRAGDKNPELQYALRSIQANAPWVSRLVIVGYCPDWLRPDLFISGNRHVDKPRNVWANIEAAVNHPDISTEAVIGNDDFFVLRPVEQVAMHHRGTLAEHIAHLGDRRDWWAASLNSTRDWLASIGNTDPKSYELHRPFPVDTARMAQVMAEAADHSPANPPQWRTVYGARWRVPSRKAADVKVCSRYTKAVIDRATYLSTTDSGWADHGAGREVRARFPRPSRWER